MLITTQMMLLPQSDFEIVEFSAAEIAERLTLIGCPIKTRWLDILVVRGKGPPFHRHQGYLRKQRLYLWSDVLIWASTRSFDHHAARLVSMTNARRLRHPVKRPNTRRINKLMKTLAELKNRPPKLRPPIFRPPHLGLPKQRVRQYDDARGTAHSRGYDRQWQKVRKIYLQSHPLCERCSTDDTPVIAELVHHRVEVEKAPDLRLEWDNLEGLCVDCHNRHHHASEAI